MIPPIKNLNICGAQIDWRKCFEKSSDQKFQYCWCRNWLEEMFQEILRSKISTLFVAKSIGGNVLMILPIQNLNIVGAEIDWMKCFKKSSDPKFEHFSSYIDWRKWSDDSSNQKFEYFWCTNWLEEMFWEILQSKVWIFVVAKSIGGNVLMIPPINNLNICHA